MGCLKVSPGCENCYAESLVTNRMGLKVWGPPSTTERKRTSTENWKKPLAWNRAAAKAGKRTRVFCASLADVFEDHPQVAPWRVELFALIKATPHLDWQLLTKRPENLQRMLPIEWLERPPVNVWLGTTVEDQKRADERIPLLLATKAIVHFLSLEPLIESVDFAKFDIHSAHRGREHSLVKRRINWVIVGGESGPDARLFRVEWVRSVMRQCKNTGVACFVKQLGARPSTTLPEGEQWPSVRRFEGDGFGNYAVLGLRDRAGADPSEWPADLRVQQFPEVPRGLYQKLAGIE